MSGTVEADYSTLANLFTHKHPLGPTAIGQKLHIDNLRRIYMPGLQPYDIALEPSEATYLMGRRGAGKTTFLFAGVDFDTRSSVRLFEGEILTGMRDLVATVDRTFTLSVSNKVELWNAVFEFAAAVHLSREEASSHPIERLQTLQFLTVLGKEANLPRGSTSDYVRAFIDFLLRSALASIHGPVSAWINNLSLAGVGVADLRTGVRDVLQRDGRSITILVDALEDLTSKPTQYAEVLKPLFALLGEQDRAGERSPGVYIRCCLPSEIYDRLEDLSENPSKDFQGVCTIHWQTRELLSLIAARYRTFGEVLATAGNGGLRASFADRPVESRAFIESLLPATVINSCGRKEDTLPYLLRHTQLLPRQLLIIFEQLLQGASTATRIAEGSRLNEPATRKAIETAEHRLSLEVVNAFKNYWPSVTPALTSLMPELPPTFPRATLKSLFTSLGLRRYADNTSELAERLTKMGVVGKVRKETEHYVVGDFAYVFPQGMSAAGSTKLCVHPMFARYRGRNVGDHKPIYPAPSPDPQAPLFVY
jgi:hypothetical protein